MAAQFHDSVLDAALDKIATGNALHICKAGAVDRATVIANSLATVALTSGDFAKSDGDVDGRKVRVAAKNGVAVTAAGTPVSYCVIDGTNLLARTDVDASSPALTSGSTTNIPAVDFEIGDPTVV